MKNDRELGREGIMQPFAHEMQAPASLLPNVLARLGLGTSSEQVATYSLEQLLVALAHEEWTMRVAAARELGRRGDPNALPSLLAALQDTREAVRTAVVEALGELGEYISPDVVVAACADPHWEVREAAVFALGRLGEHVPLAPLLHMLQDADATVRASAVRALSVRRKDVPVQSIVAALYDEAWIVREAATQTLKAYGRRVNLAPLLHAICDESEMVREAAIRTLIDLENSKYVAATFAAYARETGSIRVLAQDGLNACVALAFSSLKEQGPIEPLIEALKTVKGSAYKAIMYYLLARAINLIHEHTSIDPLLPLLTGEESTERAFFWHVITRLAESIRQEREQVELLMAVSKEPEDAARAEADQALIELVSLALSILAERVSTEHLVADLRGEDRFASEMVMRDLVAVSLKALQEQASLSSLFEGLKHSDSKKRAVAAHALTQRVKRVIVERRSPSEPLVISCTSPFQSKPLKIQFGTSALGHSKETQEVIPWRETWSHLLKGTVIIPSVLSGHVDPRRYGCMASAN